MLTWNITIVYIDIYVRHARPLLNEIPKINQSYGESRDVYQDNESMKHYPDMV